MSAAVPWNPAEPWWIITREFGRMKRLSLVPAASSSEPIDAASPTHVVAMSQGMSFFVS